MSLGISTSANFTGGQAVGAAELNAIISGAQLNHDAIDGLSQIATFDPTATYLITVGGVLRKTSGQQILDYLGLSAVFINGMTQKTPLVAADMVYGYDSVGALPKKFAVSDFSRVAPTMGTSPGAVVSTTQASAPGALVAAWNLANAGTGTLATIALTMPAAGRLITFVVGMTVTGIVGATTAIDIALVRDDFSLIYQQNLVIPFNATATKNQHCFVMVEGTCLIGAHSYYLKAQQAAGALESVSDLRILTLGI